MADTRDTATTALVYDNTAAARGAAAFKADSEKIIGANKAVEQSFGIATNRVATSISTQTRQINNLARSFDPLGAAARKAAADLAFLERTARGTGENAQRAAAMIGAAQQRLASTQKAVTDAALANATANSKTQAALGGLQSAWGLAARAAGAFGLTLGAAGLIAYGKHVLEVVSGLDELAQQVGVSTEALQAFQFAAAQGGVKAEALETAITKFSKKLGDAAGGNKEAIEAFKDLGVKVLDVQKNLRPTEDVLAEVARKILAIEEPAKRIAAEMELFGKSGAKVETILKDLAAGTDEMARRAKEAGVLIPANVTAKLDEMADKAAVAQLKLRALTAALIADIGTGPIDAITAAIDRIGAAITKVGGLWATLMNLPGFARQLGMDAGKDLAKEWFGGAGPSTTDRIAALERELANSLRAHGGETADSARIRKEIAKLQSGTGTITLPPLVVTPGTSRQGDYGPAFSTGTTTGAFDPTARGAGADTQKRIDKALRDAQLEIEWTKKIAEASKTSALAVEDMQAQFDAAKKAAAAFGDEADKNKAGVDALAKKLYEAGKAADVFKKAAKFNLETQEIERSNELLAAELKLMEAAPELRAQEIALLKVRNDLQKEGLKESDVEYQRRLDAVKQGEVLKRQLEDAKKAQEALAEPFKNAIQSLQSYIVEGLTGGFKNARQAIIGIWKRLMAELAVATVIRPIIVQPIVSVLGAAGLVPQSVVSQYGYSGGAGSAFGGGFPGLGGGGGLGDIFGFMSQPIFGGSGLSGAGIGLGSSFIGGAGAAGLTWGGLLSGIGSLGFGAFNLAQGNTLGGISGILGGGLSLLSGAGLIGSAFGPIGMGIGLIGSLLGGLFKKKPKTPQEVSNILFGDDGSITTELAYTRGKTLGTTGKAGKAFTKTFSDLLDAYDLSTAAGFTGGYLLNSVGKNTGNQWVIGYGAYGQPGAEEIQAGITSAEDAVDMLAAALIKRGVTESTLLGLTATQTTALTNADLTSIQDVKDALDFSKVYDKIAAGNDDITEAQKAFEALSDSMKGLIAQAKEYGLATDVLQAHWEAQALKIGTDFNESTRLALLQLTDPDAYAREVLKAKQDARWKEADYIASQFPWGLVDFAKLLELNNAELAELEKQLSATTDAAKDLAAAGLETLWRRLTYGDLSGASPLASLQGARSAFDEALLAAQGGDAEAMTNLATYAEDLIRASYAYSGSDPRTAAVTDYVREAIAPFIAANSNVDSTTTAISDAVTSYARIQAEQAATIDRLIATIEEQNNTIAELTRRLDRLAA